MKQETVREIIERESIKVHLSVEKIQNILKKYDELSAKVSLNVLNAVSDKKLSDVSRVMMDAAIASFSVCLTLSGSVSFERKQDERQVFSLADTLSSTIICCVLQNAYPDYGYVDEEMGCKNVDKTRSFIVDPLDGSSSWILGVEEGWAIGIALHDEDDVSLGGSGIIASVIVSPKMSDGDWLLLGVKKYGCWNALGQTQHVSERTELNTLGVSFGQKDMREEFWKHDVLLNISKQVMRLYVGIDAQHSGSWVAQGKIDAFIRALQPSYDVAPIIGLVEASGGRVMNEEGQSIHLVKDVTTRSNYIIWNGQEKVKNWLLNTVKKIEKS